MKSKEIYKQYRKSCFLNMDFKHLIFSSMVNCAYFPFKIYEKELPFSKERSLLTKYIYAYFRILDDMIDDETVESIFYGDFENIKRQKEEYLLKKIEFIKRKSSPNDNLDILMNDILAFADKIGVNIEKECISVIKSLLFDVKRTSDIKNGQIILSARNEILRYYYDCYMACHKIGVIVTSAEEYDEILLQNLGYVRRNYFILRDFFEDINRGLINIPIEDVNNLGISDEMFISLANLNEHLIIELKRKGFNHPSLQQYINPQIEMWLNELLEKSIRLLNDYQNSARIKTYIDLVCEVLFYKKSLSDVMVKLMLEDTTSCYLRKLKLHRIKNKL